MHVVCLFFGQHSDRPLCRNCMCFAAEKQTSLTGPKTRSVWPHVRYLDVPRWQYFVVAASVPGAKRCAQYTLAECCLNMVRSSRCKSQSWRLYSHLRCNASSCSSRCLGSAFGGGLLAYRCSLVPLLSPHSNRQPVSDPGTKPGEEPD